MENSIRVFINNYVLFTLLMLFVYSGFSQDEQSEKNNSRQEAYFQHSVGFGAGFSTGIGLSYRYIPKRFGLQANFFPMVYTYKKSDRDNDIVSAGLSLIYVFNRTEKTVLYIYQGNHVWHREYLEYDYFTERENVVSSTKINNSIGLGIELIANERIGVNLMAGYGGYDSFNKLNLTGEYAFYFKF